MTDASRRARTTVYPKGDQREHYVLAMEGVLYMWLGKTGRLNRPLSEEERVALAQEYAPEVFDAAARCGEAFKIPEVGKRLTLIEAPPTPEECQVVEEIAIEYQIGLPRKPLEGKAKLKRDLKLKAGKIWKKMQEATGTEKNAWEQELKTGNAAVGVRG